jgi:hypothetical protein
MRSDLLESLSILSSDFEQGVADIQKDALRITTSVLGSNFPELQFRNQVPKWSDGSIAGGYPKRMPN